MSYFSRSGAIVPRLKQQVSINGTLEPTIWCNSVNISCGLECASATFNCPQLVWESSLAGLRDAYIIVTVGTGSGPFYNVFSGYVDTDSADSSPDSNNVTFAAKSILAWIKKVRFGNVAGVPVKTHYLIDPTTGQRTNVTARSILQQIWGQINGAYGTRIRLGNLSAIGGNPDVPDPEITIRCASYQQATEQLLGYYGAVVAIQRFSGFRTYIDLIRINYPGNATNSVRVAFLGESVTDGANVARITKVTQSSDVTTKFRSYGTGRRFDITISSDDATTAKRLRKNWNTSLEAGVLKAPNTCEPNAMGALPGSDKVFKEFTLPVALSGMKKLKQLVSTYRDSGNLIQAISCHAHLFDTVLEDDEDDENALVGVPLTDPRPVSGVKFDLENNLIQFSKPCIRKKRRYLNEDTGEIVTEWEAAPVEVTICIEDTTHWAYADSDGTAAAGIQFDFASGGLHDEVMMDTLPFGQRTNIGFPIGGYQWNCRVRHPVTGVNTHYTAASVTSPTTIRSLQRISREQLANSCQRAISMTIEVPWYDPAFVCGNRLNLIGNTGYDADQFTITGIAYDFAEGGQTTTLTVNNTRPKSQSALVAAQKPASAQQQSMGGAEPMLDYNQDYSEPDDEPDEPDPEDMDEEDMEL